MTKRNSKAGAEIEVTPEVIQAALEAYPEFESEGYVGPHLKEVLRVVLLAALAARPIAHESRVVPARGR